MVMITRYKSRNQSYFIICDIEVTVTIQSVKECVCVCSNANPLHYYMLWVPCKAECGLFSNLAPLGQKVKSSASSWLDLLEKH